ncbi:MAG: hypothetical protein MZW92_75970 [Comamonadaceae bacterium]|nr:hypothetical protein [Comamonadaceae bacterium]
MAVAGALREHRAAAARSPAAMPAAFAGAVGDRGRAPPGRRVSIDGLLRRQQLQQRSAVRGGDCRRRREQRRRGAPCTAS